MHAFAVFTEKCLRPYGFNDINFTAEVKSTNLKTKMQSWKHWNLNHRNTNLVDISNKYFSLARNKLNSSQLIGF